MLPLRRPDIKIVCLCVLWYIVSSLNNVIGKTVLNQFPYPMTVTFVQLASITVYSIPVLQYLELRSNPVPRSIFLYTILPLSVGKFLASVSSHISIWKVPVSYAHTVKATMPLFTVVLSRLLFGEKQTTQVYVSLIPIITGVAVATLTELSFDITGLLAALAATCGFSLQNIYSKRLMKDTGIHSFELLAILGKISCLLFLPVWIMLDGRSLTAHYASVEGLDINWGTVIVLLVADGFLSFLQNIIAFGFLAMVTPLTYAVANATKRLVIIGISLLLLRNPVTPTNIFGISLAVGGVLLYTKAKHRDRVLLPLHNDRNFNYIKNVI